VAEAEGNFPPFSFSPSYLFPNQSLTHPSGKSSLILLLLSLLNPLPSCAGNITIDSLPLHTIHRPALRERIIAIPQDPVFLPDGSSFMENLDPFDCSTEEEGRAVLEAVGLWGFVEERGGLKAGLEVGVLSGGQRQLFSLARAVLRGWVRAREHAESVSTIPNHGNEKGDENEKDQGSVIPKQGGILLLDEVSSSVDQETDRLMQKVIMKEFKSYTIVMVSHRLEMVMGFDTVLVMDKGAVVESGTPRELVGKEDGWFRELWLVGK
jgi:ATP-binding cassette subfamily C (CFTR/MRP) protein 1